MNIHDVQASLALFQGYLASYPIGATLAYCALFMLITALCLPGAAVLLLLAGAVFGLAWGTAVGTVASSAGATLTLLAVRYGFRARLERRFGDRLAEMNAGLQRDGALYLLSLRLLPVLPFVVVNVVSGFTRMSAATFFAVSVLGMLPGTAVYVFAGRQLGRVQSIDGLLSLDMLWAVAMLGLLPLIAILVRKKFRQPV